MRSMEALALPLSPWSPLLLLSSAILFSSSCGSSIVSGEVPVLKHSIVALVSRHFRTFPLMPLTSCPLCKPDRTAGRRLQT